MKKLVKIKLINWHRFVNCTVELGDTVLLSGENGAGKSTLLDAIQFVITSSTASFNKAAHENGKRKLTGYIRCKTGRENRPYERTGQISAHVALEFYEESKDRYFIIGAVVDSASEGQETTARYLIDGARITDDMFVRGDEILSISGFRTKNKNIKQWCKTQAEAKKMIKARLGRIEDKFFSLIPKALAFKPIDDIKDFVYSYVLDEKEVNIDILRENVRTYQDLERTLDSVRRRIDKLRKINKEHDDVENCISRDSMYEFFLAKADKDITLKNIYSTEKKLAAERNNLLSAERSMEAATAERDMKQEIETDLRVELREDKNFVALEQRRRQLEELKDEEKKLSGEKRYLQKSVSRLAKNIRDIYIWEKTSEIQIQSIKSIDHLMEITGELGNVDKIADIDSAKSAVDELINMKSQDYGSLQKRQAELEIKLNEEKLKETELHNTVEALRKNRRTYPKAVERLIHAIREEFARLGRNAKPQILCEIIDIADESWRNAVEGYMNTQRFYILTEPESFDIALGIYDRLRKKGDAYGVGLINTAGLEKYESAPEGSLATVITSTNKYARQYINMLLGKVQMCSRYDELKKYNTAITKECMKYQNKVASAIKPEIFNTPFIGKKAVRVQLQQAEQALEAVKSKLADLRQRIKEAAEGIELMKTENETDIKYRLDILSELRITKDAIGACEQDIETLSMNSTVMQKQLQLAELEKLRKELELEINTHNCNIGSIREKINILTERMTELRTQDKELENHVLEIASKYSESSAGWSEEYNKQLANKSPEKFKENYERRRKANETERQKSERRMTELMAEYKTEHDFGAPASMEGFVEFADLYNRLKNSELLEYEEKVRTARDAAEEEFREQFLAKLQENMKQAQNEFKELNKALKDITFSSERYEFLHMPSRKYRSYYEMIMDDFNAAGGESLFAGIFHENHKEVIDELFNKLALDRENSDAALAEFTDYRTYMDYDIKIIHSSDEYSYYSKVCEEKSGGETQTPFYVTVAASFVQLYGNNIGGEAAGLVMFDEAFNNMDDERIGGVLEFLNRLPLQIIIAAPPDKIQYIGPSTDEILLVMTDEKTCFVEEYHSEAV